ncbi:hypothetical protein AB0C74_21870 [Spirillospora sp. NPDC048832]
MTSIPGLGRIPEAWDTQRAKWLMNRERRSTSTADQVVTAFRDGTVTLRLNRRLDGFTEALQEIGYQGIRKGDLVVHSMDGFAGAIGISDSDGKASPVVHTYTPASQADLRYYAYTLRQMALNGHITSLAKGIRERSTAFDVPMLANLLLPHPPLEEQRRIADFLDAETARLDQLANNYSKLKALFIERHQRVIDSNFEPIEDTTIPLKYVVRFIEGPGIMAEDFRPSGVPLIRVRGLKDGEVTLTGCNHLDATMVAKRWSKFALRIGDRVISGSATMGEVSSVTSPEVVGAIPYTGLIILRPTSSAVDMNYVEHFLQSSTFFKQIDALKAGAAMQHFGPTHLAQIRMPLPEVTTQLQISEEAKRATSQMQRMRDFVDRQLALLAERRQALITAAVTGQFDVSTASGRGVTE